MSQSLTKKRKMIVWIAKTTIVLIVIISICFFIILAIMIKAYKGGIDVSKDIIGKWNCVQFYKNQKSFSVPDNQEINVIIDGGNIKIHGNENASILRGDRNGTYTIEGGSVLIVKIGEDLWSCPCIFTQDGLLRLTISEMQVILYLEKGR